MIKAYTSVTYRLERRLPEFEYEFMFKCIASINVQRDIIKNRTEVLKDEFERIEKPILAFSSITSSVLRRVLPPEEKRIKKYLSLIKELIRNSEKESTMGVKSHASLFKGEYLPHLQITNSIKTGSAFP